MNTPSLLTRLKALQPSPRQRRAPLATEASNATRGLAPDIPAGADRLAEILGASPRSNRFGEHLGLRRWFSEAVGDGLARNAPGQEIDPAALSLLAPGAPKEVRDPTQWLFLDTETTGLAGGTGTYPFLVGIAWWDAGGLEVEQFFMREQSEEHSVLVALAERMAERRVLVTFNGKSFDWPLLETRFRMTRAIKLPAPRAHIDFLHPARNLWRLRLGSVRLQDLEKHVLGWNRGADVMSELDPFDLLRFFAWGLTRSAGPHFPSQSNGPARTGRACQPCACLAQPAGATWNGRPRIFRHIAHLRTPGGIHPRPKVLSAFDRWRAAPGNRSRRSLVALAACETRGRFDPGMRAMGRNARKFPRGLRSL